MGVFDEAVYGYLPEQMVVAMIRERLAAKECNAGAIFDNLSLCKLFPNAVVGLKLIMEAVTQHLQLLVLDHETKENANEENDNMVLKSENEVEQTPYAFESEEAKESYEKELAQMRQLMAGQMDAFHSKDLEVPKPIPFENPDDKLAA